MTGIDIPAQRQYLIENRLGPRLTELKINSVITSYSIHYTKLYDSMAEGMTSTASSRQNFKKPMLTKTGAKLKK